MDKSATSQTLLIHKLPESRRPLTCVTHSPDEKTEAQKEDVPFPRSHGSDSVFKLGFEPTPVGLQSSSPPRPRATAH